MKSDDKTREQPAKEIDLLKAKIAEFEKSETNHKRAKDALRSLNAAALAVQRALKPEDVFRAVASELRKFGVYTTILLLDADKKNLTIAHISFSPKLLEAGEKLTGLRVSNIRFPLDRIPQHIREALGNRATIFNQGSEQIEGFLPAHLKGLTGKVIKVMGLQRGIVAPLMVEGEVIGALGVNSPELAEKDVPAITAFANQVSIAIENARLYEAAKQELAERKQAEEALRESEQQLAGIIASVTDHMSMIDEHHNIVWANDIARRLFGPDLTGKKCYTAYHRRDKVCDLCVVSKTFADGEIHEHETEVIGADGNKMDFWCTINVAARYGDGRPRLVVEVSRDITERKQAGENMKNIKDELQMILDSVPALIIYKDTEGRIIRANKTFADSLKVLVKDIVGKTIEELFPKEQAENMRKDDKEVIISGKPKRDIIQPYTTPDGTRWTITDKMPYKDKEGKIIGVIAFAKDITVQRKSEQKLKQTYQRLKKAMDATIETMSRIIEAKDPYTSGHQHRVCQLAVPLAQELGLSEDKIEGIRIASLIHDIGKIGLPTETLSKPTTLTDIEFSLIKGHSQIGYDILKSIDFYYPIARIVLQHHERLNGSGYPNNLKGDEIILEAKIIGIADVVEAMSSHRPYRPALGIDKALEEITQNKGIFYDPEVVDACLRLFKEKGFKFE